VTIIPKWVYWLVQAWTSDSAKFNSYRLRSVKTIRGAELSWDVTRYVNQVSWAQRTESCWDGMMRALAWPGYFGSVFVLFYSFRRAWPMRWLRNARWKELGQWWSHIERKIECAQSRAYYPYRSSTHLTTWWLLHDEADIRQATFNVGKSRPCSQQSKTKILPCG
jgi:hypothetical protein